MLLESLPVEVVLEIAGHLESCRDTSAFLRASRYLHVLLEDELYLRNITWQNSSGLIWAAARNKLNTARRFLSLGADPNAVNKDAFTGRRTPLHAAARKGHLRLVQLLLENGADPRSEDPSTKTAFCDALWAGHERVARHLARHTPDFPSFLAIRSHAFSPIHVAAKLHKYRTIRWLIEAGQDINQPNAQGRTALSFVLGPGCLTGDETLRVAMALINMGANFGCGPECVPDEAAVATRDRGLAGPEPLVRYYFEHISCRCGIEIMAWFLKQRDASKSNQGWHNVDSVARTGIALLGHAK